MDNMDKNSVIVKTKQTDNTLDIQSQIRIIEWE